MKTNIYIIINEFYQYRKLSPILYANTNVIIHSPQTKLKKILNEK